MRASGCICYTTDTGYMLPTLVSAVQARHHSAASTADVLIYCLDAPAEANRIFARVCEAERINFIPLTGAEIDGANAMLARLFLGRLLPTNYTQFLYIDGDTQITGALDPLLSYPVPRGQFLASSDPMTFSAPGNDRHGREIATYFSSLGIPSQEQHLYFNTGVLRANRDGWDEIGMEAWRLFQSCRGNLRFPDQDALNLAGMRRRIPMSLSWNFPIFMLNARVADRIVPRIRHFMGSPKPWHGNFLPWDASAHRPYLDMITNYPELAPYLPSMSAAKIFRYIFQQQFKRGHETLTWAWNDRRERILNYENSLTGTVERPGFGVAAQPA